MKSTLLNRIASQLSHTDQVSKAIESRKTRHNSADSPHAPPKSPMEELLAGIWAQVLKVEGIGVEDNFFELGGSSLLATQVISRIVGALQVELPLRSIFESPTVAGLASKVEAFREGEQKVFRPITKASRSGDLPLSFAQQRLWFLQHLLPDNPLYNVPLAIRITGKLNVGALEKSINEIIRRHEVLRTTFAVSKGEPVQVIAQTMLFSLPVVDLSDLSENEREGEAARFVVEESRRPFDMKTGFLLRASLLRLGAEEHVFILNMHHAVSDRWSFGIFTRELTALYNAFAEDRPSPLPELPIQYVDYAIWQRHWLSGEELDRQLAYWKNQLAGAPPVIDLPTDNPRPAMQSFRGATQSITLSKSLSEALRALSQSENTTLFMTLLAAFQTLLARYTGHKDVVVASPIANRNRPEVECLIGFFVNTLALRTDLSGNPTFRDLLTRVREVALGAYSHQDLPFDKLVEELHSQRSLSHNPLAQVLFALQDGHTEKAKLSGLTLDRFPIDSGSAMFDLYLLAAETANGLMLIMEYDVALFDAATVARMLRHFEILLEGIVADPGQSVAELPLLSPTERKQLLADFNATETEYPREFCIHRFFETQAQLMPEATAIVHPQARLTYGELNAKANQLAHYLRKRGVRPEIPVGICAERTLEMVVGILGILKAGGAYVPLDPAYPKDRLRFILEDAKSPILLTQRHLLKNLPTNKEEVILLDEDWSRITQESTENLLGGAKPENLSYVLFTSGSTGRPKGVAIEHRSAVAFISWAKEVFSARELEGVLLATSMCFDLSIFELFVPLSVGGKVLLAENAMQLPSLPARHEVTLINTVPSAMKELVRSGGIPPSVRTVNLAGEPLPANLVDEIYALGTVERVFNLYGPTEDTTYSTFTRVEKGTHVTIGRPISNTQAYILDACRQLVPRGFAGELYLGGKGLARGYFGRPDLTAERFIPNPFIDETEARLYRTGDLVRYRPDGNIDYLGRVDNQVKLRGFRIELGEIESVLRQHSSVLEAAVMVREEVADDRRLVAYIVARAGEDPANVELSDFLRQKLPDYMIPNLFVKLDSLPLTPNGKLDRKALPAPNLTREIQENYVAPRTPDEEVLAAIWADVLKLDRVGVHDDFFELGGHSLLATQVFARLRQAFEVEVPLRSIFEAPTIAGLATKLVAIRKGSESLQEPPLARIPRDGSLPLSFAQQRVWFLDQLEPNNALYNIPQAIHMRGVLHVEALANALNEIVQRHEALRTTFSTVQDQPVQVISSALPITLPIVNLSNLPKGERESRALRLAQEDAQRPFDLATGPLIRASLLRLGPEDQILLLNMHHIISDGWSISIFMNELSALYQAVIAGCPSSLPELPIQYADYAVWQRQWLQGELLEKQLGYWTKQLKDAPPVLQLPSDRPRPAVQSYRGAMYPFQISKSLTDDLGRLSLREGVTIFMTLLAAFQSLLARYTGQEDIVVGSPIANRNRAEVEGLIGFFANTLVLRTDLSGNPSFRELLARVRQVALAAYAHQDVPFEKLVEEIRPERNLSHTPLAQVFFGLQNTPLERHPLEGLKFTPLNIGSRTAKGDLGLFMGEGAEGLVGFLEYNTDLFDLTTIQRMLSHFQVLLGGIVRDPSQRVGELPVLTEAERHRQLVEWNQTETPFSDEECAHHLFEAQVRRTPSATAVVFGRQNLTYQELNQRANRLAHLLIQRGIGPGKRVGICVERSVEMMVGLLGIWKSGAAYVPFDPTYPMDRLAVMLEDAQVPVLITQQSLLKRLPEPKCDVLCFEAAWNSASQETQDNPPSGVVAEDLAYVIFTSGSTGRPKGVQVSHRAVVNLLTFMGNELHMGRADVFPALASFAFDMSIPELYLPLVTGGRLLLASQELAGDGEALAALLQESGATIVHATPTTWNLLLLAGFSGDHLKRVIGAEALPLDLFYRLMECSSPLYNFYGPTETTVWSTCHRFTSNNEPISIGRPIANTKTYILDRYLQPVPVGVVGEIHIGGVGVSRGYLNRPDLTSDKFIHNPFIENGTHLYKTGDLGRQHIDGSITLVGRADHQVKVRGFRIELGEIEASLGSHPAVSESVVILREDRPGDKRLVAYIVTAPGHSVDSGELRRYVKERVPDYMVPTAFVQMEVLPLNPNGKVDRRALPVPDSNNDTRHYVAPSSAVEEVLANIWGEVLNLERIGVNDDFFELGGHSLLATQVMSRVRRTLHVELPLRILFESPTVSGLAKRIEEAHQHASGSAVPPIIPVPRNGKLPLSFVQRRLWFLHQMEPDNPLYSVPLAIRMVGVVDLEALEESLNLIVQRHEILRTTFEMVDDEPMQVIAPSARLKIPLVDLSLLPQIERESEAQELASREAEKPFNLTSGPLLRAKVLRLGPEEHVLLLNTHHVVSDRWSISVLSKEIAIHYEGLQSKRPLVMPALPIQYADYSSWQRNWLQGEELERQLKYWKHQLAGAPLLELPLDHARPATETFQGATHVQVFPEELTASLTALSRREASTAFMTLLGIFNVTLAYHTDQDDIVVGTDVANRTHIETESLIGCFVNLLVLRTNVSGDPTFCELLAQVREVALGAYAHQDLPFEKLVEELRPERLASRNPLVQVLFVQQNIPRQDAQLPGLKLSSFAVAETSRFDLTVFVTERDGQFSVTWLYNPGLFEASSIARVANHYEILLRSIVERPEARLSSLWAILEEADKKERVTEERDFEQTARLKLASLKGRGRQSRQAASSD